MSVDYNLHLREVFALAATIVVKTNDIIREVNDVTDLYYGVPAGTDPSGWKYYMNLAGEYHVTDEMMTVVSLDTLQEIEFTVENLERHTATRREYAYGTRYYKELLHRFPLQEFLIRGILNPVDKEKAIAAPDHSILYYDTNLVEGQEVTLIPELQRRIDWFYLRYDVPGYHRADAGYSKAMYGILISFIIQCILDIRLNNCKTQYAHSFDVKHYLKSNGRLDKYYDHMTNRQRMYFYRNLKYLHHHTGKQYIFDELMDRVLTDRSFPLAKYDIEMNSSEQLESEDLKPEIQFHRKSLNRFSAAFGKDIKPTIDVLEMEGPMATQNWDEVPEELSRIPKVMTASFDSVVPTKILESNVMDTGETEPNTLSEVLLNHWVYFAAVDWYGSVIRVDNPKGGDPLRLFAKDALVLWIWAMSQRTGIELTHIPEYVCQNVRRRVLPTREELRYLDPDYTMGDSFITETLEDNISLTEPFISVEAFKYACVDIHQRSLRHIESFSIRNGLRERGVAEMIARRPYMDILVSPYDGMSYDAWFAMTGIDVDQLTDLELETLATNIIQEATGINIDTAYTLREIHTAMIKLLSQLLSYSVQLVQQINSGNVMTMGLNHLRMDFDNFMVKDEFQIKLRPLSVIDYGAKHHDAILDKSVVPTLKVFNPQAKHYHDLDLGVNLGMWIPLGSVSGRYRLPMSIGMSMIEKPVVDMSIEPPVSSDLYQGGDHRPLSDLVVDPILNGFQPLTTSDIIQLNHSRYQP